MGRTEGGEHLFGELRSKGNQQTEVLTGIL